MGAITFSALQAYKSFLYFQMPLIALSGNENFCG